MAEISIKRNMIMSSIMTVSNFVFPLISYSYVSRVLTPAGIGKVSFVGSIIAFFSSFASLGIPSYGVREFAKVRNDREKSSKLVHELLIINLIMTVVSYIFLYLAVLSIPKMYQYKELFFVMSCQIILTTIGVEWIYKGLEEYAYITKRSILFKCFSMALTLLAIKEPGDYINYGFITVFSISANYICNFFYMKRYIGFNKTYEYEIKKHIKPIVILFMASMVITIHSYFDVFMLGFLTSESNVGLYNAALKIRDALWSIAYALTSVLIPRIAFCFGQHNEKKILKYIQLSVHLSMLVVFPFVAYIFVYAKRIILFVCGAEFIPTVPTLRVLVLCIFPLIFTNILGNQILVPLGRDKIYSQSVFIAMCINILFNIVMIPAMGACGAALATLISEIWNVFWMLNGAKEFKQTILKCIKYRIYFISSGISIVIVYIFSCYVKEMHIFLQLAVTSIIYFALYYIILFFLKEEFLLLYIKRVLKRVSNIIRPKY